MNFWFYPNMVTVLTIGLKSHDQNGYRSWLCLLVDRSGFRRINMVGFGFRLLDFRVVVGLFCGGCGFVLFYCRRYIILL